jgi:CBS domain containing-hemolysin-like protein
LDIDPSIFQEIKGDGETLAGLMLELFARMPRAGERKRFNNFIFTIVTADKKRIKNVRVTIKNAEAAPKETAGQDQKKGSR